MEGGKELGCGNYGCVRTLDDLNSNQFNWILFKADNKGKIIQTVITNIDAFISNYKNFIVFKSFKSSADETSQKQECANFDLIASNKIPNSVLYTQPNSNFTFSYIKCTLGSLVFYYPIMRVMDGEVYNAFPPKNTITFDLNMIKKLGSNVSSFLNKLHQIGYYHFDIKPENILYKKDSKENFIFSVTDYGFVNREYIGGTPGYLSPSLFQTVDDYKTTNKNGIGIELVKNDNDLVKRLLNSKGVTDYFSYIRDKTKQNAAIAYVHTDNFALGVTMLELVCCKYGIYSETTSLSNLLKFADSQPNRSLLEYVIDIFQRYIMI